MTKDRAVESGEVNEWPGDGDEPVIDGHYSKLDKPMALWLKVWTEWTARNFTRGRGSRLALLPFAAYSAEAHDSIDGERFTSFSQSQAAEWIGCTKRNAVNVLMDMSTDNPGYRPAPLTVLATPPQGVRSWCTCYTFTPTSLSDEAKPRESSLVKDATTDEVSRTTDEVSRTTDEVSRTTDETKKHEMPGSKSACVPSISLTTPITPTPHTEQDSHGPAASNSDGTDLLGEGGVDDFKTYDHDRRTGHDDEG
jgi:hypothetical protein